ncbi:PilZ domain-containing protein [Tianweitania sp.]|uniref:PilZ domain-containing protein n=1 Tax=Tianweitania sp. TaxID=2021634 RepID=UPI002899CAB9|nr:PilZ domain-containing protein [Tianweitania sp.]
MSSAAIEGAAPYETERRNFQRMNVKLYGRYMLEDRSEYPCQILDMSPGDAALRCEHPGEPGEKVIAYIDHIGRVEGVVIRTLPDGFAMTVLASERKRDRLAAQLTWLANRHELDLPEDRRHERVAPENPVTFLKLSDGREYQCRIIDLSLSGAAVEINVKPAVGIQVMLGTMRGQVVRHLDDGVAVEFASLHPADAAEPQFNKLANGL